MSLDRPTATGPAGEAGYEIRIRGHLEDRWAASFEGFTVERQPDGSTLLIGESVDQAALHGVLRQVRDLGLPLLAVARVVPAATEPIPSGADSSWAIDPGAANPDEEEVAS